MKKCFTAKVSSIMKICATQVILALALSGLCIANVNYAQVLETRITVDLRNVTFEQALQKIGDEARVTFSYSHDVMSDEKPVSIQVQDTQLGAVLEELFAPRRITYKVHSKNNLITLSKKTRSADRDESGVRENVPEVLPRYRQARVTGLVTDYLTGAPMPGVNILVKGTTRGTTTDTEGLYGIDAADDDVLVFSFIGYATEERRVGGQIRIDIALMEDIRGLDEVTINAGYYKTTEEMQTGSIMRIDGDQIAKQPVMNPLAALQAIVPGMQVVQNTGIPGGNFTVRIRGQNSIGSGNDPLFIINGVPFTSVTQSNPYTAGQLFANGTNPLNMLNPADIESIEVLKDADATAIYGARGANGVILIQTKKGATGRTNVNLNYSSGIGYVRNNMRLLGTEDYVKMRKEALTNDGLWPVDANSYQYFPEIFVWDTTRYTDWRKEFLGGTARTHDAQLSISGGADRLTFLIGGAYHSETTVFPGDNKDQRYSSYFNLNHTSLNDRFNATISVNYSVNDATLINQDLTSTAQRLAPNAPPVRNNDGSLHWGENAWNAFFRNPLAYTETEYKSVTNNLVGNAVLDYALLPNLNLKTNLGYTHLLTDALNTTPLTFYYPALRSSSTNGALFSENTFRNWVVEPQLNWQLKKDKFSIAALTGATFMDQLTKSEALLARDFPVDALLTNPRAAASVTAANFTHAEYKYSSVFGRFNFNWATRYIVNITARRDGSSRFGPGKRFANFGAIGVAWLVSNETFFERIKPTINYLKLRGSFGFTGNDQIPDYQYLDSYTPSQAYGGQSTLAPVRLSNPDFAWETNKKLEAAIDIAVMDNRLTGTVNYYRNISGNQLVGTPLPATTGFSSIQSNFSALIENSGWEFLIGFNALDKNRFEWRTSLNFTIPKNKLLEFPDLELSAQYSRVLKIGEPLRIRRLYQFKGVDPLTGLYTFNDVNGDGLLDYDDRQTISFLGPRFYGGWQNDFSYKGFSLGFLLQYVRQDAVGLASLFGVPGAGDNQPEGVLNRWRKEGDEAPFQMFSAVGTAAIIHINQYQNSDQSVADGSFLRLKNVSLSYSPNPAWTSKFGVQQLKFSVLAQNLLTRTAYPGLDPETGSSSLPPLRVIQCGINVTF